MVTVLWGLNMDNVQYELISESQVTQGKNVVERSKEEMKEAVWSSMHIKATTLKQLWYKRGQRLVQPALNGQRPRWYSQYKHIGRSVGL
jgi:hypothetical protein